MHLLSHVLISAVAVDAPRILLDPHTTTVLVNSVYTAECVGLQNKSKDDTYDHYAAIPPDDFRRIVTQTFPEQQGFPVHTVVARPEYDQSRFFCGFGEIGPENLFITSKESHLTVHGEYNTSHSCLHKVGAWT